MSETPRNPQSAKERAHADYPHFPGTLYDCWACESQCHCSDDFTCIACPDADPDEFPGQSGRD